MARKSLYEVLSVDKDATLDDIKLAFKRRALQVHPDKGGSKEAFHLAYRALETLSDPKARKSYDQSLLSFRQLDESAKRRRPGSSAKESRATKAPGPRPGRGPKLPRISGANSLESLQARLLSRIRDALKQLPRDVRNEVLSNEFSQKQRLILEQWMVDISTQAGSSTERKATSCSDAGSAASASKAAFQPAEGKPRGVAGCVKQAKDGYAAMITFNAIKIQIRTHNLPAALEVLVLLTSVKQKMLDRTRKQESFHRRLQDAIASSAEEQGRDPAQLNIRFHVQQSAGFFLGSGMQVRTPAVCSVEKLRPLRSLLEPFRKYCKRIGSGSLYWLYSPTELQDAWGRFQIAVADAWQLVSADSEQVLQKFRACHDASVGQRSRQLRLWERQRMATEDRCKHRSFLSTLGTSRCQRRLRSLRRLLDRWGGVLKHKARVADRERRRLLRQRKKELQEKQRVQALKEKQLRHEERSKREALRERMKFDLYSWRSIR